MYAKRFKRPLDVIISCVALLFLTPIFYLLMLLIKFDSKGPVLFKQKRVGIHKNYFILYKFRTMRVDTPKDTPTHLLEDSEAYITKIGRFLRKTSLDELPQLVNIISGEMSIVGPRPALWNQDDLVAERDKYKANDVRPGLTGWAQINGRDELSINEKAKLDGVYVNELSFLMDYRCLVGTIKSVLRNEGIVEGGTGQMKKEKK